MKDFESLGLKIHDDRLFILDQTLLPHEEKWLECHTPEDMVLSIKTLKVRGAPLIGVAAAFALAKFAQEGASNQLIQEAATTLRSARPTAVNLMHAIDRILRVINDPKSKIIHEAQLIAEEDVALCNQMGEHGASLIADGDAILTHCNTGGLATAGIGTALGAIRTAHEQGKHVHVFVDETRPLLQGARLTTWELNQLQIPYTLICDNSAASLMSAGRINKVFVGADRIAVNGDFANKVGTYGVAVLARYHGIPFYPVAPFTTVDLKCKDGTLIPIEERAASEVRGYPTDHSWSPGDCAVYNPSFDVTPVSLVTALVLDRGVISQGRLRDGFLG